MADQDKVERSEVERPATVLTGKRAAGLRGKDRPPCHFLDEKVLDRRGRACANCWVYGCELRTRCVPGEEVVGVPYCGNCRLYSANTGEPPELLRLVCEAAPGDALVMTAAVRSLHAAHPGKFVTAVLTPAPEIWDNNPDVWRVPDGFRSKIREVKVEYPLINQSDNRPLHFLDAYCDFLGKELGVGPLTCRGQRPLLYISEEERGWISQVHEITGKQTHYWVVNAGTKKDCTAKGWGAHNYQAVVNAFAGKILFVQIGEAHHLHPPLAGVLDLRGRTTTRQLVRLVWNAAGGLGPSTFLQHVCAALDKPYICVAGSRENPSWLTYPRQVTITTLGRTSCLNVYDGRGQAKGCWAGRVAPLGDGEDDNLCEQPTDSPSGPIPKCLDIVKPADIVNAVESFYTGGALRSPGMPENKEIFLSFPRGLGDSANFAHQIPLWQRRGYKITVAEKDKFCIFKAAGCSQGVRGPAHPWKDADRAGAGPDDPLATNKSAVNLTGGGVLPSIGAVADLWREYLDVRLDFSGQVSDEVSERVREFAKPLPRPIILLHTRGESLSSLKDYPHERTVELYDALLALGGSVVVVDMERCVPAIRPRLHFLDLTVPELYAFMNRADLLVGIDSGPAHFARFTNLPALVVWTGHHPVDYILPRAETVNLVLKTGRDLSARTTELWNVVEERGDTAPSVAKIAKLAKAIALDGPREAFLTASLS